MADCLNQSNTTQSFATDFNNSLRRSLTINPMLLITKTSVLKIFRYDKYMQNTGVVWSYYQV